MAKRLKLAVIDGDVYLVTRAGTPQLRIDSITVDEVDPDEVLQRGVKGGGSSLEEKNTSESSLEGGVGGNQSPDPALVVWRTYGSVMQPRGFNAAVLPAQERKVISDALKVATVEECCDAIRGCFASDFHMHRGQYTGKKGRKYNKLSDILRGKQGKRTTRESIDLFLDYHTRSGGGSRVTSVDAAKLRQAKQAIRDAAEFPGDHNVVDRAQRAEAWLIENGWTVSRDGEQITFVPPADLSA